MHRSYLILTDFVTACFDFALIQMASKRKSSSTVDPVKPAKTEKSESEPESSAAKGKDFSDFSQFMERIDSDRNKVRET